MKRGTPPVSLIILSIIETIAIPAIGFIPLVLCMFYPWEADKQKKMNIWIIIALVLEIIFMISMAFILFGKYFPK